MFVLGIQVFCAVQITSSDILTTNLAPGCCAYDCHRTRLSARNRNEQDKDKYQMQIIQLKDYVK